MAGPIITKEADESRQDGDRGPVFAEGDFTERTFMGGIGLSSRTGLFVVIGLACLAIGAFGLFWAQRDLAASRARLADAYQLAGLVGNVESTAWRIRAESASPGRNTAADSSRDAGVAKDRLNRVIKLGRMLDEIYKRPDTAGAGEYIATIRRAVAQYGRAYRAGVRRIDEIFSYMTPSIDGLRTFADQRLTASIRDEAALRNFYLPLIASVGAGLLLLVLLTGALIMRSIAGPIIAAAETGRRLAGGETEVIIGGLGNEDETGDITRAFFALRVKLLELGEFRDRLKKAKAEAERGRAATEEAAWLRHDLESQKAELDKGQAAIEEVELLHKVVEATRSNFLENTDDNRPPDERSGDDAPALQPPAPSGRELETPDLNTISEISQRVAQSSQDVIAAAAEAEQTGALIHDLNDAFKRIVAIESSLKTIGEQADLLWLGGPNDGPEQAPPGGNLVMFTPEQQDGNDAAPEAPMDRPKMESSIGRRFDIIRATASQATWALRDINEIVREARNMALDIAQTTSTEALDVTSDLLEQSENLRYMLDSLVHKMRDQLLDDPYGDGEAPYSKAKTAERKDRDIS